MSGVPPGEEKAAAGASRVAAQAEAPFVPEAASAAERAAGWKNPPSRMQLMLWSGSKRHVFIGMLGVSLLATIPWVMLTSGKSMILMLTIWIELREHVGHGCRIPQLR